jgi:hypothetical protein
VQLKGGLGQPDRGSSERLPVEESHMGHSGQALGPSSVQSLGKGAGAVLYPGKPWPLLDIGRW